MLTFQISLSRIAFTKLSDEIVVVKTGETYESFYLRIFTVFLQGFFCFLFVFVLGYPAEYLIGIKSCDIVMRALLLWYFYSWVGSLDAYATAVA